MHYLEELYQEAYNADIDVFYLNLSRNIKAMCGSRNGLRGIALDRGRIESAVEERVILAEEMMHFETGLLYKLTKDCNTYREKAKFRKAEAKVKKATVRKILPVTKITNYINKGISCKREIAEELDITEDFLSYAIEYCISKNELNISIFIEEDEK